MGTIQDQYTLIVMTNKDVYYLTPNATGSLLMAVSRDSKTYQFRDAKSKKKATVLVENISSIIESEVVSDGSRY